MRTPARAHIGLARVDGVRLSEHTLTRTRTPPIHTHIFGQPGHTCVRARTLTPVWPALSVSRASDFARETAADSVVSLDMDRNGLLPSTAAPPLPVSCVHACG